MYMQCSVLFNSVVYSIAVHNDAGDDCIPPPEASNNSEGIVIASVVPIVIVVLIVVLVVMLGIVWVVRFRRQQYKLGNNVSQII